MAQLEPRRVTISTGTYPSKTLPAHIAHARPFMHQIDVIFPSDPELEDAFRRLETEYYTSRGRLSDVVDALKTLYEEPDAHPPDVQVLSTAKHVPDVWSARGADLRINVAKRTYEALGLEGTKMPGAHGRFKGCEEQYALKLPCGLKRPALGATEHDKHYPRMRAKLERWDTARDAAGAPRWAFAFAGPHAHLGKATGPLSPSHADVQKHAVRPMVRTYCNVRVPVPALTPRPEGKQRKRRKFAHSSGAASAAPDEGGEDDSALQDWEAEMEDLFEWVGMAMIGSQRLQANDRVDPYIAVYSPPEGSTTSEVTHVRWKGFVTPSFLDSVVDVISRNLRLSSASSPAKPFVALTVHGVPHTPSQDKDRQVPRMEGEGENTCSVIVVPEEGLEQTESRERDGAEVEGAAMDVVAPENEKAVGESGEKEGTALLGQYVMVEVAAQWDRTFG